MRKNLISIFISFFYLAGAIATETRYECPTEIQTTQSIKDKAPEGWTSYREANSQHWLDSVSVFDGPPQELASLVPDNEENNDIKKTVWTFAKKKDRSIWFTCSYLRTDMHYTKELPLDISRCKILVSKRKPPSALGLICR